MLVRDATTDENVTTEESVLTEEQEESKGETTAEEQESAEETLDDSTEEEDDDSVQESAEETLDDSTEEEDDDWKAKKPKQDAATNARFAEMRRKNERKLKETDAALSGILSKWGVSTFSELEEVYEVPISKETRLKLTQEATANFEEPEEYIERYIARQEQRLYHDKLKAQSIENARKKAISQQYREDVAHFRQNYPTVKVDELMKDEDFLYFAEDSLGKRTISECYERYLRVSGKKKAELQAKFESKAMRSTGTGSALTSVLTKQQRRDLSAWNERFPDRKMSEQDFLKKGD